VDLRHAAVGMHEIEQHWHHSTISNKVEHVWNVMAHAQKPDLVFQRNGRVNLNWRGVSSVDYWQPRCAHTPCSEVGCKTTGYQLHSHVFPSRPLSCVTVCHQVSTELYLGTSLKHPDMSETPTSIRTFKWRLLWMKLKSSLRSMKKGFSTTSTSKRSNCSTTAN